MKPNPNPNPNSREQRDSRDQTGAQQPLVTTPSKKVTLQPKSQGDEVNTFFFPFERKRTYRWTSTNKIK